MFRLPLWVLPDRFPAIFDSESHTAIEMTAKLYGAINDFVNEYNRFATETTQALNEHLEGYRTANETFSTGLRQEFQDFINIIQLKVLALENNSNQAIVTYKNEITNMFNTYRGELDGVRDTINEVRNASLSTDEVTELRGLASNIEKFQSDVNSIKYDVDEMKNKVNKLDSSIGVLMSWDEIYNLMDFTTRNFGNYTPIVYPTSEVE